MRTLTFNEDKPSHYISSDGVERQIHTWQAPNARAVLLCIHGGLSHGADYATVGKYFRGQGITTVSPDLTGHCGVKKIVIQSFDDFLNDVERCLEWTQQQYPDTPIFIVGHSMGGLIVTHFALQRFKNHQAIKGYILSSPYFVNKIVVPKLLLKLSGLIAKLLPYLPLPLADFSDKLTHDETLQQRIYQELEQEYRASQASCRFANELVKAQAALPEMISQWSEHLLVFIAGQDELSDSDATHQLLDSINQGTIERYDYPENYHENFNEINREEIFDVMQLWIEKKLTS